MSDLKNYKVPSMFENCDFADTTMPDGTLLSTDHFPIVLERGNIIFPSHWSDTERKAYRDKRS
jgi:hypothetical protein